MEEALARVTVDIALLLEFSSSDDIDPDVAVRAMESLASVLVSMPSEDQQRLTAAIHALAGTEYRNAEFVSGLPRALGLDAA